MQLRTLLTCFVALVLVSRATAVQAEAESPRTEASAAKVEMGMLFGFSRLSDDTGSVDITQLPGGGEGWFGSASLPSLYVSWLAGERLAIGPEFSFGRYSWGDVIEDGGEEFTIDISSLHLGGRAAFFPGGDSMPGIYLLGHGSLSWVDGEFLGDDGSRTDYSAGLGMGYQWRVGPGALCERKRSIDDGSMPKPTSSPSSSASAPGLAAARSQPLTAASHRFPVAHRSRRA